MSRDERHPDRAAHLVGLQTQHFDRGPIGRDEARFEIFLDVADRSFLIEVSVPFFTLEQSLFITQPFQFGCGTSRKTSEREQISLLCRQGPCVEHREMAEHLTPRVEQRHAQVALDRHLDECLITREPFLDAAGIMAQPAADHILAGGPGQVVFDVFADLALPPVGESPHSRALAGKLGNEGILDPERRGEVPDERLEEYLARAPGRSVDDGAQGGDLVAVCNRRRLVPRRFGGLLADRCRGRLRFTVHGIAVMWFRGCRNRMGDSP